MFHLQIDIFLHLFVIVVVLCDKNKIKEIKSNEKLADRDSTDKKIEQKKKQY